MSLVVWLPLIGNTNQQGLSSITMSGSPNSWVDGKLGKCAHFAGSTANVIYNNTTDFNYTDNFSYCCWLKQNFTSGVQYAFTVGRADAGGYGYGIAIASATQITTIFGTRRVAVACAANEWHHVAVIVGDGKVKSYVDGSLVNTSDVATVPTYSDGNGLGLGCFHYSGNIYPYYGDLQDFRIYNHCLSANEVEVLSRGLVLHYQMTGGGKKQDNILIGTMRKEFTTSNSQSRSLGILFAGSGGNGTFSVTDDDTVPCGSLSWNVINNTSGNRDFQQAPIPYVSGNKYTASWWSKGNGTQLFRVWNQNAGGEVLRATWTLTTEWKYYTYTFTANDAMQNQVCTWHLGVTGSASINMCGMKLELGEKATPWSPNSADLCWNPMGYNNNTEYDTSGYLHNGTIHGSVSYSSDTPIYDVSTLITDGRSNYISAPITIGDGTAITMNAWIKSLSGQTGFSDYHIVLCIDGGYFEFSIPTTGKFRQGFYINNARKVDDYGTVNLLDTNWHMLTATFDGTSIKRYVDGTLVNTTSASGTLSTGLRTLYIGKYNTNQYGDRNLLTSDVKVYATALTQDDITNLYKHRKI